jgi:hypothetical protein
MNPHSAAAPIPSWLSQLDVIRLTGRVSCSFRVPADWDVDAELQAAAVQEVKKKVLLSNSSLAPPLYYEHNSVCRVDRACRQI